MSSILLGGKPAVLGCVAAALADSCPQPLSLGVLGGECTLPYLWRLWEAVLLVGNVVDGDITLIVRLVYQSINWNARESVEKLKERVFFWGGGGEDRSIDMCIDGDDDGGGLSLSFFFSLSIIMSRANIF